MILKILFTILVIFGAVMALKKQQSGRVQQSVIKSVKTIRNEKLFRQGIYSFMTVMVLIALSIFFFGGDNSEMNVHVINAQTGHRTTYKADIKDIKSNSFKTLNGHIIYVADIERIEVEQVED